MAVLAPLSSTLRCRALLASLGPFTSALTLPSTQAAHNRKQSRPSATKQSKCRGEKNQALCRSTGKACTSARAWSCFHCAVKSCLAHLVRDTSEIPGAVEVEATNSSHQRVPFLWLCGASGSQKETTPGNLLGPGGDWLQPQPRLVLPQEPARRTSSHSATPSATRPMNLTQTSSDNDGKTTSSTHEKHRNRCKP